MNMMLSALTLFVVGYWGGQQYFSAASRYPILIGLFAAIAILAVETTLYVIRVDGVHERGETAPSARARKHIERDALDAVLLAAPSDADVAAERVAVAQLKASSATR